MSVPHLQEEHFTRRCVVERNMVGRNGINNLFVAAVLLVAAVGVAQAATRGIPPLFRENPNARVNWDSRADAVAANYRLPNQTEPMHYDVELTTGVDTGQRAFSGTVKIDLIVVEQTRTIVVHARELRDFVATIKSADTATATEEGMATVYEEEREFLTLTPNRVDLVFSKGSKWTLTIKYKGELRTDNGGFYLSTYTDEHNISHYLATTQFESTDARHGFPCYDEPAKRATFNIRIHHAVSYKAISNMPVDEAQSTPGDTVFQKTPKMPTYLVAFIVSDFEWSEGVLNGLPQRIYSRPGTRGDQEWALVSGMLIIKRLAEYYNVEFSLPKIDQVAVPDFAAGAMENWGLATYREEYLLYNKEKSTVNTQTNIASIIAHEYCHQWFGNLVAIKFWTYLWLKEGFATLFSYRGMDDAYPEWDVYQMMHTDDYQRALTSDASASPRPMTHYVQKPSEISRLYDAVSYSKAGSVLYMFQQALTDTVFRTGLHKYLMENQYDSAEENDLFAAIQTAAAEENYAIPALIKDMMSSWSQQGGYPLLTVTRNYVNKSFTITQEAFHDDPTLSSAKLWYVPVNYALQSNPDFRNTEATHYLLKVKQITITDSALAADDWLILNKQSSGYYRINYDENNWNLIIDGLVARSHKIHPRNRAQLMHDAYKLSSTKRLNHHILLNLMSYLPSEDQYAPWSTANAIISTFNRYLSGDSEYATFKSVIAAFVANIYDKLGVNDIPGEQHLQKFTRNVAINLACMAGIPSCLEETNNKLKGLIEDNIAIEPNLQSQTYCNGLRQSSDKEFNFVYELLMNSMDQAQRRVLISSLGCAQNENHVKKFISSSIDMTNQLRTQERPTLLSAAYSRGEVGLLACIDFLNGNWQAYNALNAGFGGGSPLESDLVGMSKYANNENHETKLMELLDNIKKTSTVDATVESAMKSNIKANFDWLDSNREPIMSWMAGYFSGSATVSASLLSICTALALLLARHL